MELGHIDWTPLVRSLQHTFVVLQRALVGAFGGLCVPGAPGPSSGAWVPYHVAAKESVGQMGTFLQPTTEHQRGAQGVWSEVLLD